MRDTSNNKKTFSGFGARYKLVLFGLLFCASTLFSGCYRSEPDDHLHTVPATNNQALIEDSGRSMVSVPHQF